MLLSHVISDKIFKDALERIHRQRVTALMLEYVIKQLSRQGVRLGPSQRKKVIMWLDGGATAELRLRFPGKDSVRLGFSAREKRRLEGRLRRVNKSDCQSLVDSVLGYFPPRLLRQMKRNWPDHSARHRAATSRFEQRLWRHWRRPLGGYAMLISIADELGQEVNEEVRLRKRVPAVADALTRLHARACQIAREIEVLLRTGYADGALARWRTLHEIVVVAYFIESHGRDMAERYLAHLDIENYRSALSYRDHTQRRRFAPLNQEHLAELQRRRDRLVTKYGPSFKEDYGWASSAFGGKRATFRDIEKATDLDHWRPDYKLASHNVHAGPKGISFRLGLLEGEDLLLSGASMHGLADVGINAAISLIQITTIAMNQATDLDRLCTVSAMLTLMDEVVVAFDQVAQQHAPGGKRQSTENTA